MLYSSSNGCLFYYDRVLYSWRIAEPTMLFLLGFEAITMYDKSASDCLMITKQKYIVDQNEIEPFEYYDIFEEIYSYLSQLGNIDDLDTYIKYNCYGLKLLLNELTGTEKDRTIPIIFKNDVNKSAVDLTKPMYRISDGQRLNMSYYDLQAQKIHDIFEDAGYKVTSAPKIVGDYPASEKEAVKEYNEKVKAIHDEKDLNSDIYMLLDYKSMYSYALGVLYGCRCLGFDPVAIWKLNPEYWYVYNGQKATYFNLVSTAWQTFRFHYTSFIEDIDDNPDHPEWADKYKGITLNRLWNYGDNKDIDKSDNPPFMTDEKLYYLAAIKPTYESVSWDLAPYTLTGESNYIEPIIYSRNGDGNTEISYVRYLYEEIYSLKAISFIAIGYNIKSYDEYNWKISFSIEEEVDGENTIVPYEYTIKNNGSILYIDPRNNEYSEIRDKLAIAIGNHNPIAIIIYTDNIEEPLYTTSDVLPYSDNFYLGKYLNIDQDTLSMSWLDISEKIPSISVDSNQLDTGLLADISQPIVRYIATTPVKIYKAYQWQSEVTDTNVSTEPILERPEEYLSPSTGDYYVATGCLGWINFNEDTWRDNEAPDNKLTFGPTSYNSLPSNSIKLCRDKRDNTVSSYYQCYVSSNESGTEDDYLYGIFDRVITRDTTTGAYVFPSGLSFKSVISDDLFESCYDIYEIVSGYTLETWYNIDEPVDILVEDNTGHRYMWDGDDIESNVESTPILISYYGYTPRPATKLSAFNLDNMGNLVEVDLRYFEINSNNLEYADAPYGYWSSTWSLPGGKLDFYFTSAGKGENNNHTLSDSNTLYNYSGAPLSYNDWNTKYSDKQPLSYMKKELINGVYKYTLLDVTPGKDRFEATSDPDSCELICDPATEEDTSTSVGKEVWSVQFGNLIDYNNYNPQNWRQYHDFFIKTSKTSLYMGTKKLAEDMDIYEKEDHKYIYTTNDDNVPEAGMKDLAYLRSTYGITPYLCPVILQDDDGRYLTDDGTPTGNPLVWYDQHTDTDPYWNGVHGVNRWQDTRPRMLNGTMYDMSTHTEVPVYDNEVDRMISVDGGEYIPYSQFYNDPHHGIARRHLQVFNPDRNNGQIVDCYVDTKLNSDESTWIYCIPAEMDMTEWVQRSNLLGVYGYWIVDGTETLYDGDTPESLVIDDEHTD